MKKRYLYVLLFSLILVGCSKNGVKNFNKFLLEPVAVDPDFKIKLPQMTNGDKIKETDDTFNIIYADRITDCAMWTELLEDNLKSNFDDPKATKADKSVVLRKWYIQAKFKDGACKNTESMDDFMEKFANGTTENWLTNDNLSNSN
jgi:hypothetical protein